MKKEDKLLIKRIEKKINRINSAVRERDKPGEDISCSMANNFPKNFQETVIFHLTTMASTCREEGFGKKREREGKKREKKQKKKERGKKTGRKK